MVPLLLIPFISAGSFTTCYFLLAVSRRAGHILRANCDCRTMCAGIESGVLRERQREPSEG